MFGYKPVLLVQTTPIIWAEDCKEGLFANFNSWKILFPLVKLKTF